MRGRVGNLTDEAAALPRATRPGVERLIERTHVCSPRHVRGTIGMVDSSEGLRPARDLQGVAGLSWRASSWPEYHDVDADPLIDSRRPPEDRRPSSTIHQWAHADEADAFLVEAARKTKSKTPLCS